MDLLNNINIIILIVYTNKTKTRGKSKSTVRWIQDSFVFRLFLSLSLCHGSRASRLMLRLRRTTYYVLRRTFVLFERGL